jgi:hypothetical protein
MRVLELFDIELISVLDQGGQRVEGVSVFVNDGPECRLPAVVKTRVGFGTMDPAGDILLRIKPRGIDK